MSLTDGRQLDTLFASGQYRIPPFQRDYSWNKPQIDDFWIDALEVYNEKITNYFFGPVVFIKNNEKDFIEIVDGQQRLTTVQILICVIRDILKSNGHDIFYNNLQNFLYPTTDPYKKNPTLQLNYNNNPYFKKFALTIMDPKEKINHHKPNDSTESEIYQNYKRLYDKVEETFLKSNQNVDKINDTLYDFIIKLLQSFRVFEIIVDNEDRAFRLFATLNQRGLDLSTSDLVKNYIFMKSDDSQRDEFIEIWKKIVGNLDDKDELDSFLRHSWIANRYYVTTQSLYKAITEKIKKPSEVNDYLETLLSDSSLYTKIVHTTRDDDTGFYLKSLFNDLKNDSAQSVILNAYKYWEENSKDTEKLTKICLDVFFRGKTIGGKAPGLVGKEFANAAAAIREHQDLNAVKDNLKKIDIPDKLFKEIIMAKQHLVNNAKFILKTWERYLKTKTAGKKVVDSITLEHIMPKSVEYSKGKNPKKIKTDWLNEKSKSYVNENQHKNYLNNIGNLTLLHKLTNSELQNLSFEEKKIKYKTESDIDITKVLADAEFWNVEKIKERSEIIAGFAEIQWQTLLSNEESEKISEDKIESYSQVQNRNE